MARIILNDNEYSLYDFDNEAEFEKAVVENQKYLFGKDSVYVDIKKKIGKDSHKGIPDAFLIDFYDPKRPQLYIVENEIASHDVYSNITEQIARFGASIVSSANQIRNVLIKAIENEPRTKKEIEKTLSQTIFKNITELMLYLTEENDIKIVVAINEVTADLNLAFKIFKSPPDVILLQRYICGESISYYYEPMREEIEDMEIEKNNINKTVDFDTVVCAALEEGFKHAYVENNAWWELRLSQKARENLKYLAIYEKAPVAHISHYAEIDRIEPYKDTGRYILYLKNKKTVKPIKLSGKARGEAPQSPRYTTLSKLLNAKTVSELWS
jgi:phenylpyruvate tautomerase PptA (4-oxalocrotonate tautomerase family)